MRSTITLAFCLKAYFRAQCRVTQVKYGNFTKFRRERPEFRFKFQSNKDEEAKQKSRGLKTGQDSDC